MDSLEMETIGKHLDGLTPMQVATIEALTRSKTFTDAAAAAGVTRQSVRNWLREPVFRKALRAAQSEMFDAMALRLLGTADKAVTALEDIIDSPSAPGSAIRRAAANDVISHATKLHEVTGFEDRLTDLETRLALAGDS